MRKAFTLLETMVVVTIAAILAAIVLPVLSQSKLAAKRTACLSNTKQWALTFQMYVADSDGGYPLLGYTDALRGLNDRGLPSIWFNAVLLYSPSDDIMVSPGDTSRQFSRHPLLRNGRRIDRPRLSYPMSDILGGGYLLRGTGPSEFGWNPAREPEFANPADTVVIGAGKLNGNLGGRSRGGSSGFGERFGWLFSGRRVDGQPLSDAQWLDSNGAPFYGNRTNFAFADGHARTVQTQNGNRSVLPETLEWEKHIVPTQNCATWKIPSADRLDFGIGPAFCRWL